MTTLLLMVTKGRVASLNSRATILLTPEGNHLRLPNAQVFKGVILNLHPETRPAVLSSRWQLATTRT